LSLTCKGSFAGFVAQADSADTATMSVQTPFMGMLVTVN